MTTNTAAAADVQQTGRPILEVLNVTKTYGEGHTAVTAVADASLSVEEGQFVSMVGGLLTPTSGTIRLGDQMVSDMTKKELTSLRAERVGFVFQSSNLVPFLTARENLLYVASLPKNHNRKVAAKRADELLGELGLSDRANNIPEKLSGGERQRVAIGRALMNDPDLILVDEPTAALDTALGRQVVQLLAREVKQRGKTGIMALRALKYSYCMTK